MYLYSLWIIRFIKVLSTQHTLKDFAIFFLLDTTFSFLNRVSFVGMDGFFCCCVLSLVTFCLV
jgi:hypothetical protein